MSVIRMVAHLVAKFKLTHCFDDILFRVLLRVISGKLDRTFVAAFMLVALSREPSQRLTLLY